MAQLALMLTTFVWGATFTATKMALNEVPPFLFLLLRFLLGTVLTVLFVVALRRSLHWDRSTLRMSLIATVFLILGYSLQTVGLQYTTATNSAFITALYVILVPLFLLRFEARTWGAAALAVAGLWLLVNPTVSANLGDLLTLGCAAAFAGHICVLEGYTRKGDPVSFFVWQLVLVTLAFVPLTAAESSGPIHLSATPTLLMALAVTGVLATGAFAVQVWAQQLLPAQQVALIYSFEPAFAAWLAWYLLGERLTVSGWIGSGLVLIALLAGSVTRKLKGVVAAPAGSIGAG
jgi:drug/metabolite transporter (DMT)-like permease